MGQAPAAKADDSVEGEESGQNDPVGRHRFDSRGRCIAEGGSGTNHTGDVATRDDEGYITFIGRFHSLRNAPGMGLPIGAPRIRATVGAASAMSQRPQSAFGVVGFSQESDV